ncbi:MAG: metallophosphoesterase [Tissierellia bacterium]|nr:metallophosphoesterase [Tissierellia bacterium]
MKIDKLATKIIIAGLVGGLTALYIKDQNSNLKISNVKINSNKLKGRIKILQLTDFHSNSSVLPALDIKLRELDPDIIVMTGDIAEKKLEPVERLIEIIKRFDVPVFAILGNHEEKGKNKEEYKEILIKNDIELLDNNSVKLDIRGDIINIIGLNHYYPRINSNDGILAEDFNLILSHAPNTPLALLTEDMDLVLSGHTHGGQFRFPLIGAVYVPGQIPIPKYIKGVYEYETGTLIYVDSGLGNSRLPIRALNRVQVSMIVIENLHQ